MISTFRLFESRSQQQLSSVFFFVIICNFCVMHESLAFVKNNAKALQENYRHNPNAEAKTAEQLFFRALNYQSIGENENALRDLNSVLKLEPNDQDAYANRCGLLINLKQYAEAIDNCKKAIALGKDGESSQAIYFNLGLAQQGASDLKAAVKSFKKAADFAKRSDNLNLMTQAGHRVDLIERVLKSELSLDAMNDYLIASEKSDNGEFEAALSFYDRAIIISPDFAEAYFEKANTLAMQQKYNEALLAYAKAEQANPNFIMLYCNRAMVLAKAKRDFSAALNDLATARKIANQQNQKWLEPFLNKYVEQVNELQKASPGA